MEPLSLPALIALRDEALARGNVFSADVFGEIIAEMEKENKAPQQIGGRQ